MKRAAELFAGRGFATSSLNELAEAMGYSKAVVYNYFSSKQDLFDSIIIDLLERLNKEVGEAVAAEQKSGEKLRTFMVAHARFFEANYFGFVAMLAGFRGIEDTQFGERAMELRDRYEQLLRDIVIEGIESGAIREHDVATITRMVLSMLNWMSRWFKPGMKKTAEEVALEYYDVFLAGLRPTPAKRKPRK